MTRLLLVRHGRSQMNAEGRVQGWLDSPLDDVGRAQARAVARRVKGEGPQVLYTSPLLRARETAEIMAGELGVPLITDERLKEHGVGLITGLNFHEIEERFPHFFELWRSSRTVLLPPDGEPPDVFRQRVVSALAEVVASHPDGVVGVVTHGGALGVYMLHLLQAQPDRRSPFSFGNGSLTIVDLDGNGPRIRLVNDQCHIEREG